MLGIETGHSTEEGRLLALYRAADCLSTFFANPIYKGDLRFGATVIPVEPVVTPEEWQAINAGRAARRSGAYARRQGSAYLLSGLLVCARCGAALVGDSVPARVSTDGYRRAGWRYYICGARRARHACTLPRLGADALEAAILRAVLDEILTPANLAAQVAALAIQLDAERPALVSQREALVAEIAASDRTIARLLDAVEATPTSSALAGRLAQRESERAALALRLVDLDARLQGPTAAAVPLDELRAALSEGPAEARRAVLRAVVDRVIVDASTARVRYWIPPGPGRSMVGGPLGALLIDLPLTWRQPKAPSP